MFLDSIFLSKLSSHKPLQRNNPINTLIIVSMIFVVLFTLLTIALPAFEEPWEEDNVRELDAIFWYAKHIFLSTLHIAFELEVLFMFMRMEHLRAHIGDKKLSDGPMLGLGKFSFHTGFFWTSLFSSGVFLLFLYTVRCIGNVRSSPEIELFDFVQRKLFICRRFRTMQAIIQTSLFEEKLLIQGGS